MRARTRKRLAVWRTARPRSSYTIYGGLSALAAYLEAAVCQCNFSVDHCLVQLANTYTRRCDVRAHRKRTRECVCPCRCGHCIKSRQLRRRTASIL